MLDSESRLETTIFVANHAHHFPYPRQLLPLRITTSSNTGMIVCCLSLSFASGIIVVVFFIVFVILVIPLVILVIPLTVPLDIDIDIDIAVIRLLQLILVIFNFSKPPRSLQLTVFFKLLIDDCDEDRKEILRLVRSEDVDGEDNYTMVIR